MPGKAPIGVDGRHHCLSPDDIDDIIKIEGWIKRAKAMNVTN